MLEKFHGFDPPNKYEEVMKRFREMLEKCHEADPPTYATTDQQHPPESRVSSRKVSMELVVFGCVLFILPYC